MPLADHAEASRALMREMNLSEADIERRQKMVGLGPDDLRRIAAIKDLVVGRIEQYASSFFGHLATLEEGRTLLSNPELITRARALKLGHLAAMVGGEYGPPYVEQRLGLASLYAGAGLDTRAFLGAFHHLLKAIGTDVIKKFERTPLEGFEHFMSFNKVAFFDIGVIIDVLVFERERVIRQQQEAIRELSTPVLQIRERLLLLPLIGVIDTHRARLITDSLLRAIRTNRARVVVMDVTGVASIDSRVANHLLQTATAARLMGALVILTGVSSDVAQSLAALGIELTKFTTVCDLQGGVEEAERVLGYRVTQTGDAGRLVSNGHGPGPDGDDLALE
jgi:rsbT co-antagonist protein RsbR